MLNTIIEVFCVNERSSIPILVGLERNSRNDCVYRYGAVARKSSPHGRQRHPDGLAHSVFMNAQAASKRKAAEGFCQEHVFFNKAPETGDKLVT